LTLHTGHNIVIYNNESKTQKFIHGLENSDEITALAVSPCKRFLASAEKGEKSTVVIYDLRTLKKRKVLTTPESLSSEVLAIIHST
jgi:hypothetical protein